MKDKTYKDIRMIAALVLGLMILLVLSTLIFSNTERLFLTGVHDIHTVNEKWYYDDGDTVKEVLFPMRIRSDQEEMVIYHDFTNDDLAGMTLMTRTTVDIDKIMLEDMLLYKYENYGFKYNRQIRSKIQCDFILPVDLTGRRLSITLKSSDDFFELSDFYAGSGQAVLMTHIWDELLPLGIVVILAVLWLLSSIIAIGLRSIHISIDRFKGLIVFIFICDLWIITDSALFRQLSNAAVWGNYISFYAFMLLGIPILYFVKYLGSMQKYKVLDLLIGLFMVNAIAQGCLNIIFGIEFVDMLFVTHILLCIGVIVMIALLIYEYRKDKNRDILVSLYAFGCLGTSGILAIMLYWLKLIIHYEVLFECGILLCVCVLLSNIFNSVINAYKYQTEINVYKKLSVEDQLTGLLNRRAYENSLAEINEKINEYDNIALIYLDVNGLKMINDTYGHSVGDELIIRAAKCVYKTFENTGLCFRIGGDEFCAIVPNPKWTEEEYRARMYDALTAVNYVERVKLSMALGMSLLKDEEGHVKTISDWKYEADMRMYHDKGGNRRV